MAEDRYGSRDQGRPRGTRRTGREGDRGYAPRASASRASAPRPRADADARNRSDRRTERGVSAANRTYTSQRGDQRRQRREVSLAPERTRATPGRNSRMETDRYDPMAQRRSNAAVIVTAIVVLSVLAGFIVFWTHRPISINVDGSEATVQVGSSLQAIAKARHVSVKPGDYVSVAGDVLTEGEGKPFSAKVNGEDLTGDQMDSYKARPRDSIEFDDGADIMEDYDVQVQEQQPVLKMEGSAGAVAYVEQWGQVGKVEQRTGKTSGKTAEGDTLQEKKDCVIRARNVHPADGQRLVALTFDDGPSDPYTEQYLSILQQYDAKATFFCLGENIEKYPELAKRITDAGMQLCSHTDTHQDLPSLSSSKLVEEINHTFGTIKDATGQETTTIRPPYGSFKEQTWLDSRGTISASITWNMDSRDWSLPGAEAIVSNATTGIQPGYIILMHDGGGDRSQDVEALPQIIKTLQDQGYKFVTVSELLASEGDIPSDVARGDAHMPEGAVWPDKISPDDLKATAAASSSSSSTSSSSSSSSSSESDGE